MSQGLNASAWDAVLDFAIELKYKLDMKVRALLFPWVLTRLAVDAYILVAAAQVIEFGKTLSFCYLHVQEWDERRGATQAAVLHSASPQLRVQREADTQPRGGPAEKGGAGGAADGKSGDGESSDGESGEGESGEGESGKGVEEQAQQNGGAVREGRPQRAVAGRTVGHFAAVVRRGL